MLGVTYNIGVNSRDGISATEALQGAMSRLSGVISRASGALGILGISFAAFRSAGGFADQLKDIYEAGKELAVTRTITGQTVRDLVAMRRAFKDAGATGSVEENLIRLQKALGGVNEEGQPTATVFSRLHLSIEQLKTQSAVQQMSQIGAAIRALPSQADRAANVMQIFGRSGSEMLAVFADPRGLQVAARDTAAYGAIMERNATLFKRVTNDLEALHNKVKGFFSGFADTITPVLLPILDKLNKAISLTGAGQRFGAEISQIVKMIYGVFQSGDLPEFVGLSLRLGFDKAVAWLHRALQGVMDWLGKDGASSLGQWANAIQDIVSALAGVGDILAGTIEKGIAKALRSLKIGSVQLFGDEGLNNINTEGNRNQDEGTEKVHQAVLSAKGTIAEGFVTGVQQFSSGFTKASDDAAKRWAELAKKGLAVPFLGEPPVKGEAPKEEKPGTATTPQIVTHIKPMSDRLAAIGGFIGGHGGRLGERAQLDTAKHTREMAERLKQTNQLLEKQPQPRGGKF